MTEADSIESPQPAVGGRYSPAGPTRADSGRSHPEPARLAAELVLPVRWVDAASDSFAKAELAGYLRTLAAVLHITVVDGSPQPLRAQHQEAWGPWARVLAPQPLQQSAGAGGARAGAVNGKVLGAMTGIRAARHEAVILADDDVRHDRSTVTALLTRLERADLVRPQNVFDAWPWQARWDGARTLICRVFGADWPGTFALRRSAVLGAGGWDAGVLFENLELVRTIQAHGGRVVNAPDVRVPRRPPQPRQFWAQRVRQAYDDLAQPGRLAVELTILPVALYAAVRRPGLLTGAAVACVVTAELGRRLVGADAVPPDVPLWAPLWVAERGICVWLAVAARLRGGVRYHGSRLPLAAHRPRELARAARSRTAPGTAQDGPGTAPGTAQDGPGPNPSAPTRRRAGLRRPLCRPGP